MNAYRQLKLALELFKRPPAELAPDENARLATTLDRQRLIEAKILRSPEAARVMVTAEAIAARCREIRQRYADDAAYGAALAALGFDQTALEAEMARELAIEGALEQVAARVPPTSEVEAEIYYRLNVARFARPERRRLRHLLITFNNRAERRAAETLLAGLAATLQDENAFAAAAARHSHCPTGLEGGVLGTLPRGKLYAELDAVAFALPAGGLSAPVASEIGVHLLRCDAIFPAATADFAEVRESIVAALDERRRRQTQKSWLAGHDK